MFLPFYDLTLEAIDRLSPKSFESSRSFAATFKGVSFYFKKSLTSRNLIVSFHGARPARSNSPVLFRGYNWNFRNSDILCISDGLLSFHQGAFLSWYLDTKSHVFTDVYIEIIQTLKISRRYHKVWFTGSSGGGFSALRIANYIPANVLISNSQIYPEQYPFWDVLVKKLKDARDECIVWPPLSPPHLAFI